MSTELLVLRDQRFFQTFNLTFWFYFVIIITINVEMTVLRLGNIFGTSVFKKKTKMSSAWLLSKTWRNYPFEMNRTLLSFYTNQLIINILSLLLFDGNENPRNQRITRDRVHYKGQTIIFLTGSVANNLFQNFPPPPPPSSSPKINDPSLLKWNWSIFGYDVRFVPVRNCNWETLRNITFRKTTGKF